MSGEEQPRQARPRDQHHPAHTGGGPESGGPSQQRNRNRRSGGSGRKGLYQFEDQFEHDMCQQMTHIAPIAFPATSRPELATMATLEVARTEGRILFCDGMHRGPHIWPNGDVVD